MAYFRFEIPKNDDGTPIAYSPGWHGTISKCPGNVVVDLYNDKEGYGIAHTTDEELPKEVTKKEEKEVQDIISKLTDEEGVYFGEKVKERVSWLPEAEVKKEKEEEETGIETGQEVKGKATKVSQKAQFCPKCHTFITYLPENIKASKVIVTCPNGHRVVVHG